MYKIHEDFGPHIPVTFEELQELMDRPVVNVEKLRVPVIISSFKVYRHGDTWFIKVYGKDGEEGIAHCSEWVEFLYPVMQERIMPHMIGRDARDLEAILNQVFVTNLNYKLQGLAYWCCISWVEAAVLDMLAKTIGVNITELLGGRVHDEIDIYVASGNRDNTPEEEVELLQRRVDELGAKAIKFKLGGRMSRNADSIAGRTEGLLNWARRNFGDDFIIHADGNGSYDVAKAIEIGHIVENNNIYFYEEPCPFDDLWALEDVSAALTVPIAFGEQETSLRRFAWMIEKDAAQVIQPDLHYAGGFIQCIKVARMAAAAGKPVTPHVSGGFASYTSLLYCSIVENIGRYNEYKPLRGVVDCVPGGIPVKDGKIRIPGGVGLGLELGFAGGKGSELIFEIK